jgi:hypothetical protein
VVFCLSPLFAGAAADTGRGEVIFVTLQSLTGKVEVKENSNSPWVAASVGARLTRNSSISTGLRSTATLALGNSVLTIRPLTRLTLEELAKRETEKITVYLQTGRVRAEVTPPEGGKTDFTVRSPIATASVRGTAFDFDTVNLKVDTGRVRFAGADGVPVQVTGGESSSSGGDDGRARAPVTAVLPKAPSTVSNGSLGGVKHGALKFGLDWATP